MIFKSLFFKLFLVFLFVILFSFLVSVFIFPNVVPLELIINTKTISFSLLLICLSLLGTLLITRTLKTTLLQKSQQDAVFSSMKEGVLAVDELGQIRYINHVAAKLLALPQNLAEGMSIKKAIRIAEFKDFIENSLKTEDQLEQDLNLSDDHQPHFLQIRSSPLVDENNRRTGNVFIFSDVTRIRQLEKHRRDFVANVSHELRTPLTSIQGFAETLMNPEVAKKPEEVNRFLKIINRHANRLGAIIEDILALSKLERQTDENEIELSQEKICPVIQDAIELVEDKARKRHISIFMECSNDIQANINPSLFQQGLVNLIDNALKYSESNQKIIVKVKEDKNEVCVSVQDFGGGIPEKSLPRLFERFYRVDKARSRDMGGTGLGLAIVKHVSLAHKGHVDVQSEVGKGSTFTLYLPTIKKKASQTSQAVILNSPHP